MENPMLMKIGLQKGEMGEEEGFLASIDLECRFDGKL